MLQPVLIFERKKNSLRTLIMMATQAVVSRVIRFQPIARRVKEITNRLHTTTYR